MIRSFVVVLGAGATIGFAAGCASNSGEPDNEHLGAVGEPTISASWGTWSLGPTAPIEAMHVALMRNDKILAFGGSQANCCYKWGSQNTYLYDASPGGAGSWTIAANPYPSGTCSPNTTCANDSFCAGHAIDHQGNPVVQGGLAGYGAINGTGNNLSARYNVSSGTWTQLTGAPNRWYPTLVTGPVGELYDFAGNYASSTGEIFVLPTVFTAWSDTGKSVRTKNTYPRVHLLPNATFFVSSPDFTARQNYFYNPSAGTTSLAGTDQVPIDSGSNIYDSWTGGSVLLPIAANASSYDYTRVLLVNGLTAYTKCFGAGCSANGQTEKVWTATPARPTDGPAQGATVQFPIIRYHASATLIPTGQVVVTGGVTDPADNNTAVRDVEVFGREYPTLGEAWFLTNPATVPRNYHSVALLMRDGRIFTTSTNINSWGSDCDTNWYYDLTCDANPDRRERRVEIFAPWYYGRADRPVISSCPSSMSTNGGSYTIGIGNSEGTKINGVALMRAGSATHAFDVEQRLVWLDIVGSASTSTTVQAPYTTAAAPPGDYMLFVLKRETPCSGVCGPSRELPSIGCWTKR